MANPFRKYFSITPLVLCADDREKEIVIHARQQHVQKYLDAAAQVKIIFMEGSVYVPHYRKWVQNSKPVPVRRGENGDLILAPKKLKNVPVEYMNEDGEIVQTTATVSNPSDAQYRAAGYLPVYETEPEEPAGDKPAKEEKTFSEVL